MARSISFRLEILQRWLDAGLEFGNHGYAHLDLHSVSPEDWKADVLRGEVATRSLVEAGGGRLEYFRHPFLHTGMSVDVQTDTSEFLGSHGYVVAPVTIDNSEWIYGGAYAHAYNSGDEDLKQRIGRDYLRYMLEVVEFYEGQSDAIVGRAIPHVLLVHAYALNADWLDELLSELEKGATVGSPSKRPSRTRSTHVRPTGGRGGAGSPGCTGGRSRTVSTARSSRVSPSLPAGWKTFAPEQINRPVRPAARQVAPV